MRLHRNLVLAVIDGMQQIFNEEKYADKCIQALLKRDKRWGSKDRGFIAETLYEMVRWKRLYQEIAEVKAPFSKTDLWRMFAVWATLRGIHLPEWNQFSDTPTRRIKGRFDELTKQRKFRESIPDWLDEWGVKELGEKNWTQEISALNHQASVVLRANSHKGSIEELIEKLNYEQITTTKLSGMPSALVLSERSNVFATEAFSEGLFEVQDASSQLVAPFLEVSPGMKVVDACAGAGGKSLHLSALMENKGQLIALDIYQNKLNELKRRAKRAAAFNIETRLIESSKTIKKLHLKADRVLIDAPCTGMGVLRRNPDAKWKLSPDFVTEITQTQANILENYSKMVKPGGKLVYATCSIMPSENRIQVEKFLKSEAGASFELEDSKSISPSKSGYDGFFMARMIRKSAVDK